MKITAWAITFEPDVILLVGCMSFLIESRIWYMVSVLMHDVPFLRHMTSYMTCFVNWSILDRWIPILVQWCIGSHRRHNTNYVAIGAITLMSWLFLMIILYEYMGIFEISSYHISETRLDTNYITYIQASQFMIMSYLECDLERSKVNLQTQSNADFFSGPILAIFEDILMRLMPFCRWSHCPWKGFPTVFCISYSFGATPRSILTQISPFTIDKGQGQVMGSQSVCPQRSRSQRQHIGFLKVHVKTILPWQVKGQGHRDSTKGTVIYTKCRHTNFKNILCRHLAYQTKHTQLDWTEKRRYKKYVKIWHLINMENTYKSLTMNSNLDKPDCWWLIQNH